MLFHSIGSATMPLTEADNFTNSTLQMWQCDEPLHDLDRDAITTALMEALESNGVPVNGTHCQHDFDCCGCWYLDPVEVLHIDRSYSQVLTRQVSRANV